MLRSRDQAAGELTLSLGFAGGTKWETTRRLPEVSAHDEDLRTVAYRAMDAAGLQRARLVSITLRGGHLVAGEQVTEQISLDQARENRLRVETVVDRVRGKYGHRAIGPAATLLSPCGVPHAPPCWRRGPGRGPCCDRRGWRPGSRRAAAAGRPGGRRRVPGGRGTAPPGGWKPESPSGGWRPANPSTCRRPPSLCPTRSLQSRLGGLWSPQMAYCPSDRPCLRQRNDQSPSRCPWGSCHPRSRARNCRTRCCGLSRRSCRRPHAYRPHRRPSSGRPCRRLYRNWRTAPRRPCRAPSPCRLSLSSARCGASRSAPSLPFPGRYGPPKARLCALFQPHGTGLPPRAGPVPLRAGIPASHRGDRRGTEVARIPLPHILRRQSPERQAFPFHAKPFPEK
ncbi:hypothetical protein ABZT03_29350 [Streptomyces sp. NPDC005574]|uniref:hypothetical protein n=1 Tax=Streptomyces sp. NPDC005574 TaxID=3156891 RepID=UPI0033A61312